jgi:type I restriction enzyme S subunit
LKASKELGNDILSNKYLVEPFTILVSKLNPTTPRIWPVCEDLCKDAVCSTEFQVVKPISKDFFGFLYFFLKSNEAVDALSMAASGTSGSHQRVKPDDIFNLGFRLPSIKLAIDFSTEVMPLITKKMKNLHQINVLEKLRDTLLPKLMSGEVRVKATH